MSSLGSKQTLLDRLAHSDSDLETIEISSDLSSVTLVFSYQGVPESRIVMLLSGLVNLTISKPLGHEELAFVIMEATLKKLDEKALREAGYRFLGQDRNNLAIYSNINLYHFHLEGEICADIICRSVDLLIPVKDEA